MCLCVTPSSSNPPSYRLWRCCFSLKSASHTSWPICLAGNVADSYCRVLALAIRRSLHECVSAATTREISVSARYPSSFAFVTSSCDLPCLWFNFVSMTSSCDSGYRNLFFSCQWLLPMPLAIASCHCLLLVALPSAYCVLHVKLVGSGVLPMPDMVPTNLNTRKHLAHTWW